MRLATLFLFRGGGPEGPWPDRGWVNAADRRGIGGRSLLAVEVAAAASVVRLGPELALKLHELQILVPSQR